MKVENKFCVYVHKLLDGTVFYVGSGSIKTRPYNVASRNKDWFSVTDNNQYIVEIVYDNMNKTASLEKEIELYDDLVKLGNLVNKARPSLQKKFDLEYLRSILEYSEESPTKLLWKVTRKANGRINVGKPAGMVKDSKHTPKITIDGKCHSLHRIIWAVCNGNVDDSLVIDHIDGCQSNNSINNLRLVSPRQNGCNKRLLKSNKTGVCGVSFITRGRKAGHASRAQFAHSDSKNIQKYFSVNEYGKEEAFRLACEWRKARIEELNEQGAGYTSRHGT